jgi:hypothetical protein
MNGLLVPHSVMVYGVSGSTKTSQLYHIVKMILKQLYKETGKKMHFRMIHSDGGGWAPFADSGMIERGEVKVFDFSNRQFALADIRRLSMGYWPRWLEGTEAHQEWAPGRVEYFKTEDVCMTTDEEWDLIAGYIVEGMTSVAETLKTHISNQDKGVGFKESWKYEEDGFTVTGLTMGHYGIVQKEVYERHSKGFKTLPMRWLLYSALQGKGEDKQSRETIYGPQLVGTASTPASPQWFMDVLHLERVQWDGDASPKMQLEQAGEGMHNSWVGWFMDHKDLSTGVPYLVKARCLPEVMPKLLEYFPYGFVPLGYRNGLNAYFLVLDQLRKDYRIGV